MIRLRRRQYWHAGIVAVVAVVDVAKLAVQRESLLIGEVFGSEREVSGSE